MKHINGSQNHYVVESKKLDTEGYMLMGFHSQEMLTGKLICGDQEQISDCLMWEMEDWSSKGHKGILGVMEMCQSLTGVLTCTVILFINSQ